MVFLRTKARIILPEWSIQTESEAQWFTYNVVRLIAVPDTSDLRFSAGLFHALGNPFPAFVLSVDVVIERIIRSHIGEHPCRTSYNTIV